MTYTRNPTPVPVSSTVDTELWDQVWRSVAEPANNKPVAVHAADIDAASRPNHEWYDAVLFTLISRSKYFGRGPEKYDNDHSRYEWAYAQYIYDRLTQLRLSPETINLPSGPTAVNSIVIDDTDATWLLYDALTHYLDHRSKHDETREGMPLLLNLASRVVLTREASE